MKCGAEFFADYTQWETRETSRPARVDPAPRALPERTREKRLGYLEQREWDSMEETLLAAESKLEDAKRCAEDPAIASDADALQQRFRELADAQTEVDRLYARWAELEGRLEG